MTADRKTNSAEGQNSRSPAPDDWKDPITPVLAGAVALFVAALAAVGVTGDVLTRAVRNFPFAISGFLVVLLLATLGFFFSLNNNDNGYGSTRSVHRNAILKRRYIALALIAVCSCIIAGAISVSDREQPAISLHASYGGGQVTLTVDSSASGLSTTDQLTVQVLGLSVFSTVDKPVAELCEQVYAHSIKDGQANRLEDFLNQKSDYDGSVSILLLERLGPDSSGNITSSSKLDFPAGLYQGICAFSPLPSNQLESSRNSASYLRLSNCNESSISTSTTPTSTSSVHSDPAPQPTATITVTTTASPSWAWNQTASCSPALSRTSPPSTPPSRP